MTEYMKIDIDRLYNDIEMRISQIYIEHMEVDRKYNNKEITLDCARGWWNKQKSEHELLYELKKVILDSDFYRRSR